MPAVFVLPKMGGLQILHEVGEQLDVVSGRLPVTFASQLAHLVMKVQQDFADLVIKGDEALDHLFPPKEEQPEWATFDEDLEDGERAKPSIDGERLTEGRFALFTGGEPDNVDPTPAKATNSAGTDPPDIVAELDYESLTLAQLRARLSSLRVHDLEALLAYEDATKSRAPFQTLLSNRITRATAK